MPAGADISAFDLDRATVSRMARGDTAAVRDLYDRHARAIYSIAVRMLADKGEAEDVVQDVFTQAWRQASRYDAARAPVIGWLLVMARARTLDRLRARRVRIAIAPIDPTSADPADALPHPDVQAISAEEASRVRRALDVLSVDQRKVIELAYYDGLSQTEIAAALSQPLGTVKTRIRAGLLRLREAMIGKPQTT